MSEEQHFEGKVAVKVVLERNDKVLLVQNRRAGDMWELPGGLLNIGEIPAVGLRREYKEELGIEIDVQEVIHLEQIVRDDGESRMFVTVFRV